MNNVELWITGNDLLEDRRYCANVTSQVFEQKVAHGGDRDA
jgi:hypothetical protein